MNSGLPTIIQGGMGVAVSDWRLAKAVSSLGQLGVVSGTAIDVVMVRRLQTGDPDGSTRRALAAFPIPGTVERILERFFVDGGIEPGTAFKRGPMPSHDLSDLGVDLMVTANFVEVYLAKEGHGNPVGINYLEKIQSPHLPSLYGAMLAGVDYVLMGAGIPRSIPAVLDGLAKKEPVSLRLDVKGTGPSDEHYLHFDPAAYAPGVSVDRPNFLAIVSSHVLATMFSRLESRVDGFVVEAPTAGGHNAPPRVKGGLSDLGEPIYGPKDEPDFDVIARLGIPFWMAGMRASPDGLAEAQKLGAVGIQVGTAFAYCLESGLDQVLKNRVLQLSRAGKARIFTDPHASPTGFPFKVVPLEGTLTDKALYEARSRICDLGYLRTPYQREDGTVGWRCPSEKEDDYVRKGGALEELEGRACLCNALMSNVGLGQVRRDGTTELPILTSGDDVATVARFLEPGRDEYTAADVIAALLAPI